MLKDIRVVELASYIAGPAAAALLADYGAEVIKVESRQGDPMRHFFATLGLENDENRVFETDNRGKKSIVLDIATEDGAKELRALLATADVFITNARPGSLARAGLDYESLKALNPRLVFSSFTGFGSSGPDADKPGFDITAFWARTGLCSLATVKGGEPVQLRTGIGDHMAAVAIVASIMGALFHRERTGEGQKVETSLVRLGLYAGASEHAIQLQFGRLASTKGRREGIDPLNNFFQTSDDRWFVTVPRQGNGDWARLARAAGVDHLIDDPRFSSYRDRRKNNTALLSELDAAFKSLSFDNAAARLDEENLIWGPILSVGQVGKDAQVRAAGCFIDLGDDATGRIEVVNGPIDFGAMPQAPVLKRAPRLGEHDDEVWGSLTHPA